MINDSRRSFSNHHPYDCGPNTQYYIYSNNYKNKNPGIRIFNADLLCEKVENANEFKQIIHLKTDVNLDECISEILNKITSQNCRVRNFNMLKPSLEEVYLKYIRGDVA